MKLKRFIYTSLSMVVISCIFAFASKQEPVTVYAPPVKVKLTTNYGVMVLQLYDETPLHRDNFIKIVKDGVLDSLLFHRVIEHFMIQSGDTNSKNARSEDTLGSGGLPYTVPAEIHPTRFHKKGALAAARGDTPERESSSTQFYLVQGKVLNDSLLDIAESRINGWLAEYYIKHDPNYKVQLDSLNIAMDREDWNTFIRINERFRKRAKDYTQFETYHIPEAHWEHYKSAGGTPHLDQNYTVFGEVISGLSVIDSIAAVKTNDLDRPISDVRILKAEILEE
jgi:cyclophilin family peptidyl-prolyl cis-trans isomerase